MKMRERRGLLYGVYFQIGHTHMWTHTDPRKRATSIDLYQFGAAGAQTLGFHSAPEQWEWQRQGQWMLWCHQCPFICFSSHPAWFGLLKLKHITTVLVDACFIHLVIQVNKAGIEMRRDQRAEMRRARNRVTNGMTHTEPWSQHHLSQCEITIRNIR